ncbi:MAG: hypothetical protein DRR42_20270 [Gammaproteobacteria bacterium]|nr:MAG: hypothetical protein DRR42_20270 [Gammaproteobacteria bacterium]
MSKSTGKLPGKTEFSGRRRSMTRKSGFHSHPDSTGGEYQVLKIPVQPLGKGETLELTFVLPRHRNNQIIGYGGWYSCDDDVSVEIVCDEFSKKTLIQPNDGNWSKFGAMWIANGNKKIMATARFTAPKKTNIAFYGLGCGVIAHKHLDWALKEKPVLFRNMYQFSPEANFYVKEGEVNSNQEIKYGLETELVLKSCNRCARFLPINTDNERVSLSFSNHCVAEHRRPCSHSGFGKLKDIDSDEIIELEYGYQLECRFCKKFEVNAAHNPQRTAAQMKEDGTRRRHIELLLTELYRESPQLRYRHNTGGRELTDDVWKMFEEACFNCHEKIESKNQMHLDHTRPLALMWPLDGTGTCLCAGCNTQKRDRPPSEFYSKTKLRELSKLTGIPYPELLNPTPNMEAIDLLGSRLDWFFDEFLTKPELTKEREGKVPAELLVKALQKTLNKCTGGAPINLKQLYKNRQSRK